MQQMVRRRTVAGAALLVAGIGALSVGGCGGAKTYGSSYGTSQAATPVAYGLEAYGAVSFTGTNRYVELSGLGSPDGTTAYATAAVTSTATALPGLTSYTGTIPVGFAPGSVFADGKSYGAVTPGTQVVFRVAVGNGQTSGGTVPAIVPSSVVLTTPENPSFQEAFTFKSGATSGPLANALYITPTFTLPFTTTGLHVFVVTVADTSGQSSATTYAVPVLANGDAAVLVQVGSQVSQNPPITYPLGGATLSITNPIAGAQAQSTADSQGVAVLFASPGQQTITVQSILEQGQTVPVGLPTTVTLTAGQLLDTTTSTTSGTTPLQINVPLPSSSSGGS
jgi:hypothetical protein